jgi:hypothetical protein
VQTCDVVLGSRFRCTEALVVFASRPRLQVLQLPARVAAQRPNARRHFLADTRWNARANGRPPIKWTSQSRLLLGPAIPLSPNIPPLTSVNFWNRPSTIIEWWLFLGVFARQASPLFKPVEKPPHLSGNRRGQGAQSRSLTFNFFQATTATLSDNISPPSCLATGPPST